MITKEEIITVLTDDLHDQARRQQAGSRRIISHFEYNPVTKQLHCYGRSTPGDPAHHVPSTGFYYVGSTSRQKGVSIADEAKEVACSMYAWIQGVEQDEYSPNNSES